MKQVSKIFILFVFFIYLKIECQAQIDYYIEYPKHYMGIGTGVESTNGIFGLNYEYFITNNKSFSAAAGIGLWGYKLSAIARYYNKVQSSWAIDGGMSISSGMKLLEMELPVVSGGSQMVNISLLPASTFNLGVSYYWMLKNTNRFSIRTGYCFQTKADRYKINTPSVILTEESKFFLSFLQPGGFSLGLLYEFNL